MEWLPQVYWVILFPLGTELWAGIKAWAENRLFQRDGGLLSLASAE